MEPIVFKRWSNRKYATLCSLHKLIRIGTLSLSCLLVNLQALMGQGDPINPPRHYLLDEVSATAEDEADIQDPSLRQLSIIKPEQILTASPRSLDDVLRYTPGIDIRSRGPGGIQADLSIRASSFDQSMVLINGFDLTNSQTGHFNLDLPLLPAMLERIEVIKGPEIKSMGLNAFSGAVNFVTKPSDSLKFRAEIAYGQFNTSSASAILDIPIGKTRNLISVSNAGSDGYRENTDYSKTDVFFHSTTDLKYISYELISAWNSKSFGANAFYSPRYPDQYEENTLAFYALSLSSRNIKPKLHTRIYYKRHRDHFLLFRDKPSIYENYHLTDLKGLSMGGKFSSVIGLSAIELTIRNEAILSTVLGEPADLYTEIHSGDTIEYGKSTARTHYSASLSQQAEWNRFHINAGIFLHALNLNTIPGLYPGLDLSYETGAKSSLFFSLNRSMRLPTFTDMYYSGPQNRGNPDLLPEKALTFEGGINFKHKWINTDLSLFFRKGQESIDWIWQDSIWQSANITELNTYGGEFMAMIHPAKLDQNLKRIRSLSLSYSYAELKQASDIHISKYALDNLKHKITLSFQLDLPFNSYLYLNSSWQDRNGSYLYYSTPDAIPLDTPYKPYFLLNGTAGVKLGRLDIYLNIANILNAEYRDIGSVIMPGRYIMGGIKIR